ncbi:MAG: type IX secretion system membrane protein PorP/SprF, partial [Lewinella sp.]|nr:type IX secretion system membrane protein PorP/SprF [Lewinella sp.]
ELDGESKLEIGVSTFHINTPRAGLRAGGTGGTGGTGSSPGDRQMTFLGHARYDRMLTDKWSMAPTILWQTTKAGGNEIAVQGWAGRQVNEELKLNFGLGWRVGDAMQMMFGADYKDLRAAVSYDLNLSSANAITNYQGGFELSAYYIIKVYKKPELTPAILCPRF